MTARIRAPLRKGEKRRYGVVSEDDPDRKRLVYVCGLKNTDKEAWLRECKQYVLDNKGLAIKYVHEMDVAHVPEEDLIDAAMIGLFEAILRFDTAKAGKFSTFAVWRMKYEVDKVVYEHEGSIVRVPGQLRDDQRAVDETAAALAAGTDRIPTNAEILEALKAREQQKRDEWLKQRQEHAAETGEPIEDRMPEPRWQDANEERVKRARDAYTGPAHAQLDYRTAEEGARHLDELRMGVREALADLPPLLRAVVADEHDIDDVGADFSLIPKCPVKREIALQLGLNLLKNRLRD